MDDAQKELEGYVEEFEKYLGIAGPAADIILALLERVREEEVSEKIGEILDKAVGEVLNVFRPLYKRSIAFQDARLDRFHEQIKKMCSTSTLKEETAVELLKLQQNQWASAYHQGKATFWENHAGKLQKKLTAAEASSGLVKAARSRFGL